MDYKWKIKRYIKENCLGKYLYFIKYFIEKKFEDKQMDKYIREGYGKTIKKYKKISRNKRCFIIGNGPSLTVSDLELLNNEDTFASNRIIGVFNQSGWRPSYYCVQDEKLLCNGLACDLIDYIEEMKNVFLPYNIIYQLPKELINNSKVSYIFNAWRQGKIGDEVVFSEECDKFIGCGMTVTYAMIQLAVYMGYSEIFLIGVDNNYIVDKNSKATIESYAAFIKKCDLSKQNAPHMDLNEKAYRKALEYCNNKNIVIKNATRGGKLEIFERIGLEEVLK